MIPSFHASFLSRKQILESGTRFRLNQECWISHSESGWHDGLVVLLLLGKLAGVRMPVWKKDSLTAVASPLKWGRVMEVGGMGPGMQCVLTVVKFLVIGLMVVGHYESGWQQD